MPSLFLTNKTRYERDPEGSRYGGTYGARRESNNLFSFPNLLKAYYQCRKNKRRTLNAAKFELNFEKELLRLETELKNKTYCPGRSICFAITEPKLREVFAADFRDRVVHHLLVNHLEPLFEPKFIHCSFACRKNKGALKAIKTIQKVIRQETKAHHSPVFYIHIDISAFFTSLNQNILFKIIKRYINNPEILWLAKQIIFYDPVSNYRVKGDLLSLGKIPPHKSLFSVPFGQGLPIGNLTSQFFANVYLNELDQYAKHQLKIKHYIRYVDDIVIVCQSAKQLKIRGSQINNFLQNHLRLRLQPDKEVLQSVNKGINFLGYMVKPNCLLVRNRTVRKFKNKLFLFNRQILRDYPVHPIRLWTPELCKIFQHMFASVNSYYGLFKHADTFCLRRHLYRKHFGILKYYLIPADSDYNYFAWSNA